MNQKKMRITFHRRGEVNIGDTVQCPKCRKKFVILPGMMQYKIGGGVDVVCGECAVATPADYYEQLSAEESVVELPMKRRRANAGG